MAYSRIDSWNNMWYRVDERLCSAWSWQSNNTLTHVSEDSSNDVDRRVKPDDLIDNMTSQPKQFERESKCAILSYLDAMTKDYSCPYPYPKYEVWKRGYIMPGPQYTLDGSYAYDDDWATELRVKIKDTTINLGQTLAEYKQSARMFGSFAETAVDAWKIFRRKKSRRGLSPCSVPSAFLVYTYGVSPLINDLYDSVEALRLRLEHPLRKRYYCKADMSDDKVVDSNWGAGPMKIHCRIRQSQRVTAYVEFDLERASLFRMGNPLEIAWELVPYSFVIDGMIPVGDFLASLDALTAVQSVKIARVEKVKYDHLAILERTGYAGQVYTSNTNYSDHGSRNATYRYRSHERVAGYTIPLPAWPTWSPSSSYKKVVNNLMLLWQTFGQNRGHCRIRKPRYLPGLGLHSVV